ncbi:MAG: esterase family protein [Treponema sp.]|nr:esterase family protein [Treponema sp.]
MSSDKALMEIDVSLCEADTLGEGSSKIVMIPFSARTDGAYFTGATAANGVDTQRTDARGKFTLSARYMLKGHDFTGKSCGIFIENNGSSLDDCVPTVRTDSEALSFMERADLRATVQPGDGRVTVRISLAEIPPDGYDSRLPGTEYPRFQKHSYFSQTAGRDTHVNVLLPARLQEGKKYPVLYLLHGFFDTEDWMARPEVALPQILGNLQQAGLAKDMIVVLPYIYCSRERPAVTAMDLDNCLAYDNFIHDFLTDLKPFVEQNFPAATGRENTAITGFSMGGRESLFIAFTHPELFDYVGAACPAPGLVEIAGSPMHPGQIAPRQMKFSAGNRPRVLLISSSLADDTVSTAPDSYRGIFTENGEPFLSQVLHGTAHDHTSVKPHLYNFLRMLF